MKSPNTILQLVLSEMSTRCGTSTIRDVKTVSKRLEHEGLSFLTITLANFGADFQKSLDQGFVGHDQFLSFSRSGGLPRFLGGFLDRVFDRKDGRLRTDPSIECIYAIRQITLMFAKMKIDCTQARQFKALSNYVACEKEVRHFDRRLESSDEERFSRVGRLLWARLFSAVDNRIYSESVIPRHGPGVTADKLRGNAKYSSFKWTRRLESLFPHWENQISSLSFLNRIDRVTLLEPGSETPVKVILVPKTLKTPRIIAAEPTCMQYMQQGLLELLSEEIRCNDNASNFVMSDSQEPNQWLAEVGSRFGNLATLDLSEASDRVSNQHVRALVANHKFLRESLDATRSRKADVPGHGVIRLAKFASMGSALCFPFEAMVFTTVIFSGIARALNRDLTQKDLISFYGLVRVYGDDIIIPVEFVQPVVSELETFGFRVNVDKSFWNGKFRESCGREYYDGHDVSIVRMRTLLPTSRLDAAELVSTISFRNQLFQKGYVELVDWLDNLIEGFIPFPVVEPTSVLLGRQSWAPASLPERTDSDTQTPLVLGVVCHSKPPASPLDDFGALLKWFLKRGDKPFADKDHLQHSGRPVSAHIKNRWARPY